MIIVQTRLGCTLYDGVAELPESVTDDVPTPTMTLNDIPEEAARQDEETA